MNATRDKLWIRATKNTDEEVKIVIYKILDGTSKFAIYKNYIYTYSVTFASNIIVLK